MGWTIHIRVFKHVSVRWNYRLERKFSQDKILKWLRQVGKKFQLPCILANNVTLLRTLWRQRRHNAVDDVTHLLRCGFAPITKTIRHWNYKNKPVNCRIEGKLQYLYFNTTVCTTFHWDILSIINHKWVSLLRSCHGKAKAISHNSPRLTRTRLSSIWD